MRESTLLSAFAVLALLAGQTPVSAATVDVDGNSVKTLSAAIAQAEAADDGPHVINLKTDALSTADGPIIISEPVTINGDGNSNGEKCDILVDIAGIQNSPPDEILLGRAYIKLHSAGSVIINDIKIHPNADGNTNAESDFVDAIRVFCPSGRNQTGNYELNRVWISGSDKNNGYISLENETDLYNQQGNKLWSRQASLGNRGIIHCANRKANNKEAEERGEYNLTLNDCQVGLGRGVAFNFTSSSGTHKISGGLFGHCGAEAIRIAGNTISLTKSSDSRLKVIRAVNNSNAAQNSNIISFSPKAGVDKIDGMDVMLNPGSTAKLETIFPGSISRNDVRLITDEVQMAAAIKGLELPEIKPFEGWQDPEKAWSEAQSSKKDFLIYFYSPGIAQSDNLTKIIDNDSRAKTYLSKLAAAKVNVKDAAGKAIAQKYGVFKVPTILVITPDAKAFKKVTPSGSDWAVIQKELTTD